MIQITDRDDFKDKLAYLIAGNVTFLNAGVAMKAPEIEAVIDQFIDQFDLPEPKPSKIPLPPVEITGKPAHAYIARNRINGIAVPKTLSTGQWASTILLQDTIPNYDRHNYEIVALYPND